MKVQKIVTGESQRDLPVLAHANFGTAGLTPANGNGMYLYKYPLKISLFSFLREIVTYNLYLIRDKS